MLVLKLKSTDRVLIGTAVVDVRDIGNGRVRLAINAPEEMPIINETTKIIPRVTGGETPSSD